jgi:hypothetical protein
MASNMEIKCAVFVIGSLFWDPDQGQNRGLRKRWRADRLIMKEKIHVKAPIRYGRLSGSTNEEHYTMVFSKGCDNETSFGTAYVIAFRNKKIRSLKGIENQARFLSKAEGANDKKLCKGGNQKWCTIGLLFNTSIDSEIRQNILTKWKELLKKDDGLNEFHDYKIGTDESVLSDHGEILIKWPEAVDERNQGKIDEFDLIIATCTKPNLSSYPTIDNLRKCMQKDKRKYFYQNIMNGITTFEDRLILKK